MDTMQSVPLEIATGRVHKGLAWLNTNAWGWWVPLWAHTGVYTKLVPAADEKAWTRQEWHILAVAFEETSKYHSELMTLRRDCARITYSRVVTHFRLTDEFLVQHGFEPDEKVSRYLLDALWLREIFGSHLDELIQIGVAKRTPSASPRRRQYQN